MDRGEAVTAWLLEHLARLPGDRVLDLAGGSGTLTLAVAATGRPAYLVCTDVNVASVATTCSACGFQTAPSMPSCAGGDSCSRPTPSRFLEARRVLRPGGRLALAVWGPPEDNPWQSILDVELEVSGIEDRSAQGRPGGMFGLADETALRRMLREAGFSIRKFERVPLVRRYRDFEEYWAVEVVVEIERSAKLRALSATAADAFRRRLEVRLSPYRDHGHYEIPGLNLAVAAELPIARTVT